MEAKTTQTNQTQGANEMITPTKDHHSCRCWSVDTGRLVDGDPVFGPCGANTRREFAPGHDAKHKGVLIRLHLEGRPYLRDVNGGLATVDPMDVATARQWQHFLRDASLRAEAKASKPKSTAATQTRRIPSSVKVGRWTHGVTRVVASAGDTWTVEYKTAKGEAKEITVSESKLEF
jgi:hypothetical protein